MLWTLLNHYLKTGDSFFVSRCFLKFLFSSLIKRGLICRRHKIIKGVQFKKVMENWIGIALIFIMLAGVVYAGGWDSFVGEGTNPSTSPNGSAAGSSVPGNSSAGLENRRPEVQDHNISQTSPDRNPRKYTTNFYIALGVGGLGVLIVVFLIYLLLRQPKDKWSSGKSRAKNNKSLKGVLF